jgi:uncharacterized protein
MVDTLGGADDEIANGYTRTQIARCISSRRLDLTLLPTEKCNFRCVYCYEDFELGRMPSDVVAGVKNLISRRAPKLEELQISWFGGEPLLALPVIHEICKHSIQEADRYGFKFGGGLTTNAYLLTPKVLTDLVDMKQTFYQVSIDGTEQQHNKTRIRADGAGTFETIWANMLAAKAVDRDFTIQFRVHMTPDNFESLKSLMVMLRNSFGSDNRFRLDLQHIRKMGGAGNANVKLMSDAEIAERAHVLRALANTGEMPPHSLVTALADSAGETAKTAYRSERGVVGIVGNDICYAAKPNHWLIRANGRVGRCTVILNDARNDMGRLLPDGTMDLIHERIAPWFSGLDDLDPKRLTCPAPSVPPVRPEQRVIPIAEAVQ